MEVGLVGFGPANLSVLAHWLDTKKGSLKGSIFSVFDPGDPLGLGTSYGPQSATNLLNTSVNTTSLYHTKPHDFLNWLKKRPSLYTPYCTEEALTGAFVPRAVFGQYLSELREECFRELTKRGGELRTYRSQVVGVTRSKKYVIDLENGKSVETDYVVVAIGNKKHLAFPKLVGSPGFFTACSVPSNPNLPVAIIGTRLSAIDAILQLASQGHMGPIHAISTSGFLPEINYRLNFEDESPHPILNLERLKGLSNPDRVGGLYHLLMEALAELYPEGIPWDVTKYLRRGAGGTFPQGT